MKRLKSLKNSFLLLAALMVAAGAQAQCVKWQDAPNGEAAEEAHVLYRDFKKAGNMEEAFKYWQKAYEIAPAADGQRPYHFTDGREFYLEFLKTEADEAKKKEYVETINRLYDEERACYENEGYLYGRQAYDMFYFMRTPYSKVLPVLESAVEKSGNDLEYIVLDPYAHVVVWLFEKGRMDTLRARAIYTELNEIADYNALNNQEFGSTYEQAKAAMNATFSKIEYQIFDCAFYKEKFEPVFRENPEDFETMKTMYNRLVAQGCDESDPLVAEIKAQYDKVVAEVNAEKLEVFYAENPGAHAKALYDEGKYDASIEKYKEAIEKEKKNPEGASDETLGNYNFAIASILFRKQKKYSSARDYALKAAKQRPGWGQPYMAIGDMYAQTSSSCGKDAWDKQIAILAAMDKYRYAKSIDSSVAEEANSKLAKYAGFRPEKQDGFMRGVKEGQKVKVGCWIGESVRVSFQ
ncbi:MAG: hypothetical protein AAGH79_04005 [Bacteroidota bacterium]